MIDEIETYCYTELRKLLPFNFRNYWYVNKLGNFTIETDAGYDERGELLDNSANILYENLYFWLNDFILEEKKPEYGKVIKLSFISTENGLLIQYKNYNTVCSEILEKENLMFL